MIPAWLQAAIDTGKELVPGAISPGNYPAAVATALLMHRLLYTASDIQDLLDANRAYAKLPVKLQKAIIAELLFDRVGSAYALFRFESYQFCPDRGYLKLGLRWNDPDGRIDRSEGAFGLKLWPRAAGYGPTTPAFATSYSELMDSVEFDNTFPELRLNLPMIAQVDFYLTDGRQRVYRLRCRPNC